MLRSVDGGGEVDLDKRAITDDDDIIELDQLHAQNAEPPAAQHDSDPTPARGAEDVAAPTSPARHATLLRRIVVLSDETGDEPTSNDARCLDPRITAAPAHPARPETVPLLTGAPARPRPASRASSGSPQLASRRQPIRPRPLPTLGRALRGRPRLAAAATILVLGLTTAGMMTLGAGSPDHRAHNPRTTASRATIPTPLPPTIPRVANDTRRRPARTKRTTSRRRGDSRQHPRSVTAHAPANDAATQQSAGPSQTQTPTYTPVSAVHSQTPASEPSSTSGSSAAPAQTPPSSNGTSTQVSKATLKSLVTGAGTCGCQ